MPKFMRSHDDAGETASVLDDGHAVHLVAKAQQSEEKKNKAQRSKDGEQQRKKQSTTVKIRRIKKVSITFSRRLLTTQAPPT